MSKNWKTISKICEHCFNSFECLSFSNRKYCFNGCSSEHHKLQNRTNVKHWRKNNPEKFKNQKIRAQTERRNYWLWKSVKRRSKARGLEFSIEPSDIIVPEFCPILGLRLTDGTKKNEMESWSTLDRIDSTKGYIKGNIQVISFRANSIKRDASPEELKKIANFVAGTDIPD